MVSHIKPTQRLTHIFYVCIYIFPQSCKIIFKIINVNITYSLIRIILGIPNYILLEIRILKQLYLVTAMESIEYFVLK